MILSFAWTTPAVVLGEKTETRRDWQPKTIAQFKKLIGKDVEAWDRSPRFGGHPFGIVKITGVTAERDSSKIRGASWTFEGFHVLQAIGATISKRTPEEVWRFWKYENEYPQTVVGFQLKELNDYGIELRREAREEALRAGVQLYLTRDECPCGLWLRNCRRCWPIANWSRGSLAPEPPS